MKVICNKAKTCKELDKALDSIKKIPKMPPSGLENITSYAIPKSKLPPLATLKKKYANHDKPKPIAILTINQDVSKMTEKERKLVIDFLYNRIRDLMWPELIKGSKRRFRLMENEK